MNPHRRKRQGELRPSKFGTAARSHPHGSQRNGGTSQGLDGKWPGTRSPAPIAVYISVSAVSLGVYFLFYLFVFRTQRKLSSSRHFGYLLFILFLVSHRMLELESSNDSFFYA